VHAPAHPPARRCRAIRRHKPWRRHVFALRPAHTRRANSEKLRFQDGREDDSGAAPMGAAPALDGGVFGEFTPLEDDEERSAAAGDMAAANGSGAAKSDGRGVAPGELPWARASRSIRSPLLRLHNGD